MGLAGYYLGDGDARQPYQPVFRPATNPLPPARTVPESGHPWGSYRASSEIEAIPSLTLPESQGLNATIRASNPKMQTPSPVAPDSAAKVTASRYPVPEDFFEKVTQDEEIGLKSVAPLSDANRVIINFNTGSVQPPEDSLAALDSMVEQIRTNPRATILVEGYTDSSGDADYNRQLSKFRAMTVKSYFIGKGIQPSKIDAVGMGTDNPIASNATLAGRNKNRRVEIKMKIHN
jgi:outer membrane protein OmpA-like peptidoglycan-associated protein